MNLTNKTALVTGANGGLGLAIVKALLNNNIEKIYCGVRDLQNAKVLENLSDKIELLQLDLSDHTMLETNLASIEKLDLLINNAGVNSGKTIFEDCYTDFTINVQGTLKITQLLADKINENGAIVNITSILALCNFPLMGFYSASKSALHSLTQALRAHMNSKKVTVLEVLPGPIDTKMTPDEGMPKASPESIAQEIILALAADQDEIYPDEFAKMIKEGLTHDPKSVEQQFAQYLG
ncbi:SDR family NAD(P)-dependent oxidoreductase [Sulfurimonas marina]|uniref:SDR family NAD(P)-dependent oxidoreductase n=1 Tax=Sulfurimonas marina TaxID=2590551 RepID=A0A7M1B0B5_9BACT|nr:SDR family NAD(P)-dependent oxidoreductase [Sulfurimonas marina]QOP42082.1 SDR family NAD(P)-dependent oxidoreductase [Sulfurimonas marina]